MSRSLPLGSRQSGRRLAAVGAALSLGLAVFTAVTESDRVLRIYDGFWMIGGGAVAFAAVASLVWRWKREAALPVLLVATAAGCWLPLVVHALRTGMSVRARIQGGMLLGGADVVGTAFPVGLLLLWFVLHEEQPRRATGA